MPGREIGVARAEIAARILARRPFWGGPEQRPVLRGSACLDMSGMKSAWREQKSGGELKVSTCLAQENFLTHPALPHMLAQFAFSSIISKCLHLLHRKNSEVCTFNAGIGTGGRM